MKKMLQATVCSATFALGGAVQAAAIDLFTEPAVGQSVSVTTVGSTDSSQFGPALSSSILGDYRDLVVSMSAKTSANPANGATLTAGFGELSFSSDVGVSATGAVQWDGDDSAGTIADLDVVGLAGLDVTAGCGAAACDRFITTVLEADNGFPYQIEVWDMDGDASVLTADTLFAIPGGGGGVPSDYEFGWFNLGTGDHFEGGLPFNIVNTVGAGSDGVVDFNNLGAVQFIINSDGTAGSSIANIDLLIGSITTTNVPVPGSIALLGLGGLLLTGFGFRGRKV